jgi:hypothetical protein
MDHHPGTRLTVSLKEAHHNIYIYIYINNKDLLLAKIVSTDEGLSQQWQP